MPTYDLKCQSCGREWERFSTIAHRADPCEDCGGQVEQLFKHSVQATPFVPYFDVGLGREITSYADRWRAMRQTGMQYRDKMSPGDMSARRDRIEEAKRHA